MRKLCVLLAVAALALAAPASALTVASVVSTPDSSFDGGDYGLDVGLVDGGTDTVTEATGRCRPRPAIRRNG